MINKRNFVIKVTFILIILISLLFPNGFEIIPNAKAGFSMPLVVTTLADSGQGSLRYYINNANDGDTIIFADDLSGTISLSRELYIQRSISISGPGWDVISLDGNGSTNIIRVVKNQTVDISGVSIVNGNGYKNPGGGVANDGTLSLSGVIIDSNVDDSFGAGVYNSSTGSLTMFQCTVSNNTVNSIGGALGGGGIWNNGVMTLNYVRVLYNTSPVAGGGIYNDITGNLTMNWVWITGNVIHGLGQDYAWGAGLMNQADYVAEPDTIGWVSMNVVTIDNNEGSGYFVSGGGISNIGSMSIQKSKILNNKVNGVGGGIDNQGSLEIIQTTISGNTSEGNYGDGGGIENSGSLSLASSTVNNNTAYGVGGGVDKWMGEMWINNSTIGVNYSYTSGGGIYNYSYPLEINNTTIVGNIADSDNNGSGEGGGLVNEGKVDPSPKIGYRGSFTVTNVNLITYVTIGNSILSGNIDNGGEANDCFTKPWASVTSNGYNLIQDTSNCIIDGVTTGNIYNIPANLFPLANYGGPTYSYFPAITSPIIDAGSNNSCLPNDQRGAVRPSDGNKDNIAICDIGSIEGILGPSGTNWAPFANPQLVYTYEDNPIGITLVGIDPEGDSISFFLSSNPSHGVLSGDPPFLTYTPDPDYFGTDTFDFYITDSYGGSSNATVTINVLPINDAPVVEAGSNQGTVEGFPVSLEGSYIDVDEDSPPYIIWDMGDGNYVEGTLTPTYTYNIPGVYYAVLYVVDNYKAYGYDYAVVFVQPRAELTISLSTSDTIALSGAPLIYSITIYNSGPSDATNIVIDDLLPPELVFSSASPGCSYYLDIDGQKVMCILDYIPVNSSETVQIIMDIPNVFTGNIIDSAQVMADEFDTNPYDSYSSIINTIVPTITLYCNDFEYGVGPEWSNTKLSMTPYGRIFLGDFSNEKISLNLETIPIHTQIHVTFDLFLIRSWEGNRIYWNNLLTSKPDQNVVGPDHWIVGVDGINILDTSFSNWDSPEFTQSYPEAYPYGQFPSRFGSSEQNSLGYFYGGYPMDSVYQTSFLLQHNNNTFTLDLSGYGLQEINDESWGIDNFCVSASYSVNLLQNQIYLPLAIKP